MEKMKAVLPKVWHALMMKHLLNDANWKQWHTALFPIGLLTMMNNLFPRAFLQTFSAEATGVNVDVDREGAAAMESNDRSTQGEVAKEVKIAVEFWKRKDSLEQLVVFRIATLPQTVLMAEVLRNSEGAWDLDQMVRVLGQCRFEFSSPQKPTLLYPFWSWTLQ